MDVKQLWPRDIGLNFIFGEMFMSAFNKNRSFQLMKWHSGWSVHFVVSRPGVYFPILVIPKDFKKRYLQLPCLAISKIGIVWRTSQQACLLCSWARHLRGAPILCGKQVITLSSLLIVVAQSN